MRLKIILTCLSFLFFSVCGYAQKEEAEKLKSAIDHALDIIYDETYQEYTYDQRASAIRKVLEENYDLTVLIRRILGRNWRLLSSDEQSRIDELVTQLVVQSFIKGIQGLGRPDIAYADIIPIDEKRFEISSIVTFPNGDVINILYRLGRAKTGWQIIDITAEKISVIANYRQQVSDHFKRGTAEELIKKLETFLEEGNFDENTKL